ncbi:OLA1 [Symbiodinium necroappetens]|uniref:OLA1 protein n=1 Tax=Symbiodinium necroappetens TaxID=1628268 RepID=A0A812XVI7_9DINO|nr:OLA1 [Symbiodinium necroappetens]
MLQPHPIQDVLSRPAAIVQTELAGTMVCGRGLTAVPWEGLPTATAGAKIRQADVGLFVFDFRNQSGQEGFLEMGQQRVYDNEDNLLQHIFDDGLGVTEVPKDTKSEDVAVHDAYSGVQCRHLCQAHETCAYWTYIVKTPQVPDSLQGRCFLKSSLAAANRELAHPFVVSGERLCVHFSEGLSAEAARGRVGLQTPVWRTSVGKQATTGTALLPGAGTEDWYREAAKALDEVGFVVILDALSDAQTAELLHKAKQVAEKMLLLDPERLGNRGPRRYSFGGASRTLHLMHIEGWEQLLDNEPVNQLLAAYYSEGFLACGGGGDFVLGSTSTYQSLHLDVGGPVHSLEKAPAIGVNFALEDISCADAPMRAVPYSHQNTSEPPDLTSEPQEMKDSVLCPLPRGSALVRDLRVWHGGTPSGSSLPRFLPNAEFVSLLWGSLTCGSGEILDPCQPVLPRTSHARLSPFARAISARLVDNTGALDHAGQSTDAWLIHDFRGYHRHKQEAY